MKFKKQVNFNKIVRKIRVIYKLLERGYKIKRMFSREIIQHLTDDEVEKLRAKIDTLYKLLGKTVYLSKGNHFDGTRNIFIENGPATLVFIEETQEYAYVDKNGKLTV